MRTILLVTALGCAPAGCGSQVSSPPTPVAPSPAPAMLSPVEHAVRASLALRGLRPSAEELDLVRADPDAVPALVDAWIASPEFATTIREMHGEQLLVLNDANNGGGLPQLGPLVRWNATQLFASYSQEPLRLVERVVTEGRPYSEIVTADWMMADEIVSVAFGPAWDPAGPEWQVSRWTDGRPHAGLLSSTQVWRRHLSNANNFHRARVNTVISGILLCDEIAHRPVDFGGVSLPVTSDTAAVADALMDEPACRSCHQSLDPLASTLWGFKRNLISSNIVDAYERGCTPDQLPGPPEEGVNYGDDWCYPIRFYHPENEGMWADYGLRAPGYYGTPVTDLADLGRHLAADPRFTTCTISRFVSYFEQVPVEAVPKQVIGGLLQVYQADEDARALVRAIVLSDGFRTRPESDGAGFAPGMQRLRPQQLARVIDQLTGFSYGSEPDRGKNCSPNCGGVVDLVTTEDWGYLSLLGGVDSKYQVVPIHSATPLATLTIERVSAEAAAWVVARDLAEQDVAARHLLTEVDGTEVDGSPIRAQLAVLYDRILIEDADDAELDQAVALFAGEIARSGDPSTAWTLVITALLRDPRMMYY